MPQGATKKLKSKTWLDFQNDVKVSDVELAAQEGFESVEHTKEIYNLGYGYRSRKIIKYKRLGCLI